MAFDQPNVEERRILDHLRGKYLQTAWHIYWEVCGAGGGHDGRTVLPALRRLQAQGLVENVGELNPGDGCVWPKRSAAKAVTGILLHLGLTDGNR